MGQEEGEVTHVSKCKNIKIKERKKSEWERRTCLNNMELNRNSFFPV
jgi:hypothetical protein